MAPELSIVVAAQDAGPWLEVCLRALAPQVDPGRMEVIVVDGSGRAEFTTLLQALPGAQPIYQPAGSSVPVLWAAGLRAARGELVALTFENCVPSPNWVAQMVAAHRHPASGIGGAIEPGEHLGFVDWAVYFSRYSNYGLPYAARPMDDLAADNCAYKRHQLIDATQGAWPEGFWETFENQKVRAQGGQLQLVPEMVMAYQGGLTGWRFLQRRFVHGRYFASRRSAGMPLAGRLARALGAPLVPLVLTRRIFGRVWSKGRFRGRLLAALPLIIAFLVSWAAGEAMGYLQRNVAAPHGGAA